MRRVALSPVLLEVAVLVIVAALGYLAGHARRTTAPAASVGGHVASLEGALIEYPPAWRARPTGTAAPPLALANRVVLGPTGSPASGLLAGQLPDGEAAPLPRAFLARLTALPQGEVISLLGFQAYRYTGVRVRGYDGALSLYVIPRAGAAPTALGCFAAPASASVARECEQVIGRVSLVGTTQYDLSPDVAFAGRLGSIVTRLDRERLTVRARMAAARATASVGAQADALAASFAAAATQLAGVEPPPAAARAQGALADAIRGARDAYATFAAIEREGASPRAGQALGSVERAEAAVDGALRNFALLGYSATRT